MSDGQTTQTSYQASGRRNLRLFLEGREVPVSSATVVHRSSMPAMASIEMVPLQVIKFIKPRTQVHLMVRDSFTFGDDNYYLCFEGEVLGRSMIKRHDSRSFRITAFDYSNYWDDAKAYQMNPNFIAGKMGTVVLGEPPPGTISKAAGAQTVPSAANSNALMVDYMTRFKDSSGNPDIIRGIGEIARRLASVNLFYLTAYERLRILDRIFVQSSGRIGSFLKALRVEEFLSTYTGSQGGMMSLRQMLMGIMTLLFHDSVSVPFPSFVKTTRQTSSGTQTGYSIAQFLFIPDTYLLPPPKCNVIFPNQQIGFEFDEDFRAVPTRYGFRCTFPVTGDAQVTEATYPIQYYPRPFADYMFGAKGTKAQSTTADLNSGFGPSQILKSSDGRTYGDIYYGGKAKDKSVSTAYTTTLRESDYLSNEEAMKGIYYETDVLVPAYSALVRSGSVKATDTGAPAVDTQTPTARNDFMREVGSYLFFKKRYGARQVSTEIMFNPFLVPGFNALFLDDSDAGQSFIAKVQGVTHQMTHQGWASVAEIAYARDFDEIDFMSGGAGDPPLPRWFDPSLYGTVDTDKTYYNLETNFLAAAASNVQGRQGGIGAIDEDEVKFRNTKVQNPTIFPVLSKFYQLLLGCDAITGLGPKVSGPSKTRQVLVTTRGATQYLIQQYKSKGNQAARDAYVREYVNRPVTTMTEAFAFIGASVASSPGSGGAPVVPSEFAKFTAVTDPKQTGLPGRFDGTGYPDATQLKIRRDVIDSYVALLKQQRGFRG